jgi:hypothetical protein
MSILKRRTRKMMQTKFIIQMTMPTRPDLEYFYCGEGKSGLSVFELKKSKAKRYDFLEEADRDARILGAVTSGETFKVITIRCRT